jgi:hypothetical protein
LFRSWKKNDTTGRLNNYILYEGYFPSIHIPLLEFSSRVIKMNQKWKIALAFCLLMAVFSGSVSALSYDAILKYGIFSENGFLDYRLLPYRAGYDGYEYEVEPGYEEPGSDFCGEGVDMILSETGEIVTNSENTYLEGKTRGCGGHSSDTAISPQNKRLFEVFSLNKKYSTYCSSCGSRPENIISDSVKIIPRKV